MPRITAITDDAGLRAASGRWSSAPVVGVDTEFVWERTYLPRPGLVQVADDRGVTLVDPVEVSDFGPLVGLLTDPSVDTIMHACDEDLDVLRLVTGATPRAVWDTQLAGAFAGYGSASSYAGLVKVLLGVVLDKGLTRSDWLQRPLSEDQLRYAALDVAYLARMHERLSRELADLGRVAWYEEEFAHRRRTWALGKQPETAYLRVRGRGALRPPQHAVLRALSRWREVEAMTRDIPRRHVLPDAVLIALSSVAAPDRDALRQIETLSRRAAARYDQQILACIDTARAQGPAAADSPVNLRPHADTLNRLKAIVQQAADRHRLPPELLASRRALETLVTSVCVHGDDPPLEFQGWRYEVVTTILLDCIHAAS